MIREIMVSFEYYYSDTTTTSTTAMVLLLWLFGVMFGIFVGVAFTEVVHRRQQKQQQQSSSSRDTEIQAILRICHEETERGCDGDYAIPVRSYNDVVNKKKKKKQENKLVQEEEILARISAVSNASTIETAALLTDDEHSSSDEMENTSANSSSTSLSKKKDSNTSNCDTDNNHNGSPLDKRFFNISSHDTALLLIDMQTDFVDSQNGRLCSQYESKDVQDGIQQTTRNVEKLLRAARKAGLTIAQSRSHRYGATIRTDLLHAKDKGYDLIDSLQPLEGEIVVDKWTFGAFASTNLEEELRSRGVRKILLGGVLTNVCVFATAVQAVDRFFRVCLVDEAAGSFNPTWHTQALTLINEPQVLAGHAQCATGLYFGELAKLNNVVDILEQMSKDNKTMETKKEKKDEAE